MENNEIAPAPATTVEDLFAKMDMILSATQQWTNNDDDALGAAIYRRVNEIPTDISSVQITPEHLGTFNEKATALNKAFRIKNFVNLAALNSLN